MSQRKFSSLVPFVLCGVLAGCGGQQKPKEAMKAEIQGLPKWALGKCQEGLKNKDAICGTGGEGMSNISLARSAAEGRARTELARSLQVRVKSMLKDYQAATTGGSENQTAREQHIEDVSKQISDVTLSVSRLEDSFVSETGTFWALVALDTESFKDSLKNMNDLDERIRAHIERRADHAFRELDAQ